MSREESLFSLEEQARTTSRAGEDLLHVAEPSSFLPSEEDSFQTMVEPEHKLPFALEVDERVYETLGTKVNTILPTVESEEDVLRLVPREEERYKVLKSLGEGGAGEVILVYDRDIQRDVAMKLLKHQDQALQVMRFVSEVQTIGNLEHPNIVPIHDVGVDHSGQYYFTMKYIEGETLRDVIDKLREGSAEYHQKYTFERRTQIFVEILQAIRFAHERGFIHRDIKPENIMLGPYGEVQVMDWGIAKRIRNLGNTDKAIEFESKLTELKETIHKQEETGRAFQTEHGAVLGTPMYMSPEQALGSNSEVDERSDIYSLSVMFYEFLTLRHYLEGQKGLQSTLFAVLQDMPEDPATIEHEHQGRVPRELSFFVRRGYQKQPDDRFQTVADMLDELQANLEGRICVYCPSTFVKRGAHDYGHYIDNHRILGVVWVCLGVILVGLGIFEVFRLIFLLL